MIHALKASSGLNRAVLIESIEHSSDANLPAVLALIRSTGAIESARRAAWNEAQLAIDAANQLPANEYSRALIELAESLQTRQN